MATDISSVLWNFLKWNYFGVLTKFLWYIKFNLFFLVFVLSQEECSYLKFRWLDFVFGQVFPLSWSIPITDTLVNLNVHGYISSLFSHSFWLMRLPNWSKKNPISVQYVWVFIEMKHNVYFQLSSKRPTQMPIIGISLSAKHVYFCNPTHQP